MKITGAEAVIRSLIAEGVEIVYGYPGGAIMPIYDAIYGFSNEIKHVLVRHEQGATHAAQGYARVKQEVGVCFATSGPGATNLITGIADAQIDSTPMVCITGQVPVHLLGTDAFQETDVIGISMPVTKWNYQVTRAEEIPQAIAKAFYIAKTGRPGPVLIDITKNAQFEEFNFSYKPCTFIRSYKPKPKVDTFKLDEAAALINKAERPYLIFGHGIHISKSQEVLRQFLEKTGIPAVSTLMGLSAIPTDHPNYKGYAGMHGNYAPNLLVNECDVMIAVGMRFDDRVTGALDRYAKQAKLIHIEIDPAEIDKNMITTVALHADAKEALEGLLSRVERRVHTHWSNRFDQCAEKEFEKVIQRDLYPDSGKLRMGEVVKILSDKTNREAIVVTDVGQHQMAGTRYYEFARPYSNISSGGLGTMGFALPAAMGAHMADPERTTIAIIGDGGFQMTLQELGTIFQENLTIKIVILNNEFLGMVRQWQQLFFDKRYASTPMINPDFVKIAGAYNIAAKRVEDRSEIHQAIDDMLAHNGSYLLEVMVEKEENVFPMVPSGACASEIRLE